MDQSISRTGTSVLDELVKLGGKFLAHIRMLGSDIFLFANVRRFPKPLTKAGPPPPSPRPKQIRHAKGTGVVANVGTIFGRN